jgi:hypothetical protein
MNTLVLVVCVKTVPVGCEGSVVDCLSHWQERVHLVVPDTLKIDIWYNLVLAWMAMSFPPFGPIVLDVKEIERRCIGERGYLG